MLRFHVRFFMSMAVLGGLLLCGCGDQTAPPGSSAPEPRAGGAEVLVMVEGEPITADELDRRLDRLVMAESGRVQNATVPTDVVRADLRSQALSQLIDRQVQLLEARKRNLTASAAQVEERVKRLQSLYASPQEFEEMVLRRLAYTIEALREDLRDDLLIEQLTRQWIEEHPVEVTEAELRDLYESRRARGQLEEGGHTLTFEEFRERLGNTAADWKAKKEYGNWVSELRSSAQVVEMGRAELP